MTDTVLRIPLTVLLAGALTAGAFADSYVVSPRASEQTKAAIAAGKAPRHGLPAITAVHFSSSAELHPGAAVDAVVETSHNVRYVEGRVQQWNVAFTEIAPGRFRMKYRVPLLPPDAIGSWELQVIARSVDGVEVRRTFPVNYRYF